VRQALPIEVSSSDKQAVCKRDGCWWPKADEISIDYTIYMVRRWSLEGPLHPNDKRALQGPLICQKTAPEVSSEEVESYSDGMFGLVLTHHLLT
jgi:hypothetical protein